jgi:CheY-like chemotaxis protein
MSAPARTRKTAEVLLAQGAGAERRRDRRLALPGVAAVKSGAKFLGLFTVADLSAGGMSLIGEALVLPQQLIEIEVQLPGRAPLVLTGKVLRRGVSGARGRRCAIRFVGLGPQAVAGLTEVLAAPAIQPSLASLLVVWNRASGRPALERDLADLTPPPLFAASALEAAAWLRVPGGLLEAVLVDYLMAGSEGWDFLQHLREHHPQQKRILLVDGVGNFRLNLLLSSGLADAALEKPWTAAAMARKLGR